MPLLSYKKDEHLKHRKLIDLVFAKGKSKVVYPICYYWVSLKYPINNHPILFGANTPKKRFKKAVDRNRIKRQMREAYRTQKELWSDDITISDTNQLAIMAIYVGKEMPDYSNVKKSVKKGIGFILRDAHSEST